MMRRVFLVSTALFWIAVFAFWAGPLWLPEEIGGTNAVAGDKTVTMTEVARHAKPGDCWMAIDDIVYDFTAYLPQHPAAPELMTAWCGKEATEAYRTKTKGRPHSPYADQLLAKYRIGRLAGREYQLRTPTFYPKATRTPPGAEQVKGRTVRQRYGHPCRPGRNASFLDPFLRDSQFASHSMGWSHLLELGGCSATWRHRRTDFA